MDLLLLRSSSQFYTGCKILELGTFELSSVVGYNLLRHFEFVDDVLFHEVITFFVIILVSDCASAHFLR